MINAFIFVLGLVWSEPHHHHATQPTTINFVVVTPKVEHATDQ